VIEREEKHSHSDIADVELSGRYQLKARG
jgi:hypothetical protein